MTAPRKPRRWILVLGLMVGGVWTEAAAEPVPGAVDPWTAVTWLPSGPGSPREPGVYLSTEVTVIEALPGITESRFEIGREPGRGWGGRLGWGRIWGVDPAPIDHFATGIIRRTGPVRSSIGASVLRAGGEQLTRLTVRTETRIGSLLAGGWMRLAPETEDAAPEFALLLRGALASWFGGVDLGPGPGVDRWAFGARLPGPLVWTAAYAQEALSLGLAWRVGGSVLQVEQSHHPWLGASVRVLWILRRGGA